MGIEERVVLLVQAVLVLLQAGWLSLGAYTNLTNPRHNRDYVISVVTMELIRDDSPQNYDAHRRRRLSNPSAHALLFRLVVAAEALTALALWVGAALLATAAAGVGDATTARALAMLAVLGFTCLWGTFLVGGEWFLYWASPNSPQHTHFFMLLWGIGTLLVLI